MAGGLTKPMMTKRLNMAARLTPNEDSNLVRVEESSPWAILISASCHLADATRNMSPAPKLDFSVFMSGKKVESVGQIDLDLLDNNWESFLNDATSACVYCLLRRQVSVPDGFRERLLSSLRESRVTAILHVVRLQALSLIQHVPSSEACRIWSEAEMWHILGS